MALLLCGLVLLVSGWTRGTHQGPPTCWSHNSRDEPFRRPVRPERRSIPDGVGLQEPACTLTGHRSSSAAGDASAIQAAFSFGSGWLPIRQPAPLSGSDSSFVHPQAAHAGNVQTPETATSLVYANMQLGGPALEIAAGTITVGRSMRDGTFALRSRRNACHGRLDLRRSPGKAFPHTLPHTNLDWTPGDPMISAALAPWPGARSSRNLPAHSRMRVFHHGALSRRSSSAARLTRPR